MQGRPAQRTSRFVLTDRPHRCACPMGIPMTERLNLSDLKAKTPADLLAMAEEWEIENAPSMRKGEMMFQILKEHAEEGFEIGGDGVLEVLQDGFGFLAVGAGCVFGGELGLHGACLEITVKIGGCCASGLGACIGPGRAGVARLGASAALQQQLPQLVQLS